MSKFPAQSVKVNYNRPTSLYASLQEIVDRKIVDALPFVNTQVVSFSSSDFAKISSSVLTGTLAIGSSSTTTNGGVMVASVAGSFATGSLETVANSQGRIMNKVEVRDATTNDPIMDGADKVYGLLQSANGTADGASIGASGSENLRLVLFKYDGASSDALTLATYTGSVEFQINKLYTELTIPNFRFNGGTLDTDIIAQSTPKQRKFIVTTAYQANEIINLTTGNGSVAGASTVSGDSITFPSSASAFNANGYIQIFISQGYQSKGSATQDDVTWQSATSYSVNRSIDIDEVITVIAP